jgi:hypothetical protein
MHTYMHLSQHFFIACLMFTAYPNSFTLANISDLLIQEIKVNA